MNPLSPDQMTQAERLDEVARLLALAILRRRERAHRQSESLENGLLCDGRSYVAATAQSHDSSMDSPCHALHK